MSNIYVLRELDKYGSITEALNNLNASFSYRVLKSEVIEANKQISTILKIPLGTKVFSYKKLRIVNDVAKTIEQVYIDYSRVNGIEKMNLKNQSLYAILQKSYNIEITYNEENIRIVMANDEESRLLNLEPKTEVLISSGITFANNNTIPFEYFEISAVHDFFRYRSITNI